MIIFRDYDKEKRIDRVWYQSSHIIYSECQDIENDFKILKIVFKGGKTYVYKGVNVNDYVMFVHGGTDGSNGKALNKYIIPKCECEKVEDTDLSELQKELETLQTPKEKTEESAE